MPCRQCITAAGEFPAADDWKIILLPSEVERIARLTGKSPAEFADTVPLAPAQSAMFMRCPDRLWARLLERWEKPTGLKGACPFLAQAGCQLPGPARPFICQAYPLSFNITTGEMDCAPVQTPGGESGNATCLSDNRDNLQKRFKAFRRECIDLLNRFEGLTVRDCERRDKPRIMEILRNTPEFLPMEVGVAEEVLDLYLDAPAHSGYYTMVAELNGQVAGYISYGPTPMTESTWDIYWMATDPQEKNRGIGRELLERAEEKIFSAGARLIVIETSSKPNYTATRGFYLSRNYRLNHQIDDFYAPGDALCVFIKRNQPL